MERSGEICCRDCSICKLPQAMNITTMMACAIDQIFQRQLKQEEEIGKISQILSEKNNEMYNLAEKPTKDDKEYESMDELQETGENGEK